MRRRKFGNKHCVIDGLKFHSLKEGARYRELKLLQSAGKIKDLKLQVKFDIKIHCTKVCTYIADFTYLENGKYIVEDVKGMRTAVFNLKKKLLKAVRGIDIRIT